ncbi:Sm-like protein LSM2 [Vitis vinifera]|uniref:Sm-like protein LSM2 n=1 Tax=Vitis vinifera TaxID=29760 RepID=A0A438F4K5_VITVI|nr:Sm-like protein LSM2 [Vitis vinifera]
MGWRMLLKRRFPLLFRLASIRNAIVIDLQEAREMKANNHHFGRYLEDSKMGKVDQFMELIYTLSVRNCFIRGSVVRYVQLPPEGVDIELLHDATRREARGG